MRIGVFLPITTFVGPLVGRHFASKTLLDSLIAHGQDIVVFSELTSEESIIDMAKAKPIEALPQALERGEIDLLYEPSPGFFGPLCEIRNSVGSSVPVSTTLHSFSHPSLFAKLNDPNIYGHHDLVICPSSPIQEVVARACPRQRTTVIPHPVVLNPGNSDLWGAFGGQFSNDTVVITSIARFSSWDKQDLSFLVRAVDVVRSRNPQKPIALVLAGAAGEENEAAKFDKRGPLDRTIVNFPETFKAPLLERTDIFVSLSSSVQESFGIAPVEAMMAGCPIVATAFSGHLETIPAGAGFLVPVEARFDRPVQPEAALKSYRKLNTELSKCLRPSFSALVESLDALVKNEELRVRCQSEARKGAQKFRPAAVIPQYLKTWKELVDTSIKREKKKPLNLQYIYEPLWKT